ncbi:MAG: GNAT family N-acetyltransferase [Planctomycetes bacterium]|nr:GNAT family N-acetyltransferase [Planctomycetota bacterium]
MNSNVTVRPATESDEPDLVAFNLALAEETEGRALDATRVADGVAAVLADSQRGRYFVAERAGAVVGGLLVTTEWSDWRNGWFWWLQSVYVVPDARRSGVYTALHRHVVEAARRRHDVCGVRLYVERENRGARAVYERLGMHHARYEFFELDFVLDQDA